MPIPVSSATRKALFAGASVLAIAAVETACGQPTYGGPVDGTFVVSEPAPTPRRDAAAPPTQSCLEAELLSIPGVAQTAHADVCTGEDIERALAMCKTDSRAPGCVALSAEKPDCARCIVGPLPGERTMFAPIGANPGIAPIRVDGRLCGASVVGRDDCQLPLLGYFACLDQACASCNQAGLEACRSAAAAACATEDSRSCMASLEGNEWRKTCTVSTASSVTEYGDALFRKSATWFCTSGR